MSRIVTMVPDDNDLLCERCGYVLNGLSDDSRCPECGQPIADSRPEHRRPAPWEDPADVRPASVRFAATTAAVVFQPSGFFRHLQVRRHNRQARQFAWLHWALASLIGGAAVWLHLVWFADVTRRKIEPLELALSFLIPPAIWLLVLGTNALAAWLTYREATWRGLRMPLRAVRRGLYYHAPHYVPPALALLIIVGVMHLLCQFDVVGYWSATTAIVYLYTLSGAVVIGAGYLFWTYWIAMRNIMFANG